MDTFIVRQPIMNPARKVVAYEVVYQQDSSVLYNQRDTKVANAVIDFFVSLDNSNFMSGKDVYLTFTPNLLMRNIPKLMDEKKLVIQLEDNVLLYPAAREMIRRYYEQGYRLALVDFDFNKRYLDVLPMIDTMKINYSDPDAVDIPAKLSVARQFGMKIVAYNVNTPEAVGKVLAAGVDGYQGQSVADMVESRVRKVEHLQSNFFRLMAAITREMPEFDEIAQLIGLDVTLTFSLFRIVNSAYFGLKNRVKDIKQALTVLGIGQLKQWIYLMSFSSDSGASDEMIKLSFQRATFCQELSQFAPDFPVSRSEAYLLGMFSTLDVLLEVDMADAVRELPISDELKDGLMGVDGKCAELLKLCLDYERGSWGEMSRLAVSLAIPVNVIGQKYFESVEYVNDTWDELMRSIGE